MKIRLQHGYTLVELALTITIAVVLGMLAVPNLTYFIRQQKIKNASFDLTSAVALARSEAIKRNGAVNVTSQAAGWNAGWSVAPAASASTAIRSEDVLNGITITEANTNTQFTFSGAGRMTSPTSLAFTIQPTTTTSGLQPLCVKVGATGRAQTTKGAC